MSLRDTVHTFSHDVCIWQQVACLSVTKMAVVLQLLLKMLLKVNVNVWIAEKRLNLHNAFFHFH